MRSFLLTLCGALCLSLSIMAEQPVFVDSLTKVTLPLPEKSNVTRFASFKKAEVDLPKSYLFIYSMKNEKNEKFSWERINQFDEKEKYGTLLRSQRFNEQIEGWVRYYQTPDKKKPYISCVTLVRGDNYAFYMVEAAYNEADLLTLSILENAIFPHSKQLVPEKDHWILWVALLILFLLPILAFPLLKKLSDGAFWCIAILSVVLAVVACFLLEGWSWLMLFVPLIIGLVYLGVSCTDSWGELVKLVFKNIADNV